MNTDKRTNGILFKTFMFTTALIIFVALVTFGVLYAALPPFYLYMKTDILNVNLEKLATALKNESDTETAKDLIAAFCVDNNAEIVAYGPYDEILSAFTYPFVMMDLDGIFLSGITGAAKPSDDSAEMGVKILFNRTHVNRTPELTVVTATGNSFYENGLSETIISRDINSPLISKLTLFSTLQPIDEAQNVVIALIPFLLIADVIIALAAAYFYARTLTRPVLKISKAAALMQDLSPGVTSGVMSGDEFGELGKNLDTLYVRLCSNIESLKSERDKVAELERAKTDFMRAASHELKTPLAALTGILEGMIDNVGVYKDHQKYLAESKHQVDRLAALVNEILRAARLEHLHETEKLQDVDVAALLGETLDDYSFAIADKNIRLTLEAADLTRCTDRKILKTTLSNLISNAVKYSADGGAVTVRLENVGTDGNPAELSIENECEPIPSEAVEKLFEPFYVLDYSRGRQKSGTGLGLYLVKRNLEQLQIQYSFAPTDTGMRFTMFI